MSGLLGFIIFCAMCAHVLTDGKDCIFDWDIAQPEPVTDDTLIDTSGLQISTLEEGGKTYHYLTGTVVFKEDIDDSFRLYNLIEENDGDSALTAGDTISDSYGKVCNYFDDVRPKYMLPLAGSHNNYPPQDKICPIQKGTWEIFPVNSSQELMAPSELENGRYNYLMGYLKGDKVVGGFSGYFTVIRD